VRGSDPSFRGVLLSVLVIRCNSDPLHLQRIGRRGSERKTKTKQIVSQLVTLWEFVNLVYLLMCIGITLVFDITLFT